MYVGRDFSPMEQQESDVFGLDFVNDLDPAEKILVCHWFMTVAAGVDPNPTTHLQGPCKLFTTAGSAIPQATIQRIGGLLPGVNYKVTVRVETDFGNFKTLWTHIYGEEPL